MNAKWFYIAAIAIGLVGLQSCSDDDDNDEVKATSIVLEAFLSQYPNATGVEWELKHQYYVAEFYNDNAEMDSWYNAAGEWQMTETDIRVKENLPEAVQTAFANSQYADWAVEDIDKYERPNNDIFYLIEVEKTGEQDYDLYYRPDGTVIKYVADTPNDDILPTTVL